MSFLQNLTLSQLLWLIPILFAIHNLEEAPGMEKWTKRIPSRYSQPVTTRQFSLAVTLLTLLVLAVTILAVNYPENRLFYLIIFEFQTIILFNVFVPHLFTTIRFKMYSPGLISGIFLLLPFSIYFFHWALAEGYLSGTGLLIMFLLAPPLMILLTRTSLWLGSLLLRLLVPKSK
jgi:hypothetical protein